MANKKRESEQEKQNRNSVPILTAGIGTRIEQISKMLGGNAATGRVAFKSDIQIGRYIREESTPGIDVIVALAKAAGVTLDWLATGEGPQRISDLHTRTPGAFDAEQLRLALETVEEGLAATGRQLAPDKKADLVTAVYELLAGDAQVDRGVILRLVKSAG